MALPSHSDRTAPETGLGLALPPQLEQTLPETAAASVSQFCEMAPGIPWSNQILDDGGDLEKQSYTNYLFKAHTVAAHHDN